MGLALRLERAKHTECLNTGQTGVFQSVKNEHPLRFLAIGFLAECLARLGGCVERCTDLFLYRLRVEFSTTCDCLVRE